MVDYCDYHGRIMPAVIVEVYDDDTVALMLEGDPHIYAYVLPGQGDGQYRFRAQPK